MTTLVDSTIKVYPIFTLAGSLILLLSILVTALAYRGTKGQKYSILNHFISELGEVGVSRLAPVFNIGMIIAGTLFLPMMLGLGFALQSIWARLGMVAGLVAAVSCICVGIFPMNNMKPHATAALTYFRSGLLTVLLFTIAIIAQPAENRLIPLGMIAVGILSTLTYAIFLFIIAPPRKGEEKPAENLDPTQIPERPRFWKMPFWEWLVFFSTILWFIALVV